MAESRALLLIADIGGYTNYMSLHRVGLAHAQANIGRLLEAVIDAAPDLELIEIEGDAAFFSKPQKAGDAVAAKGATDAAVAMHRAFHERQQRMVANNLCSCGGCVLAGELKLKCVAHVGDVSELTIKDRKTLAGVDVILVHRLLKNAVPIPEYVLLSDDLYRSGEVAGGARAVDQELEGLGSVRAYFVDLGEVADPLPPAPAPSLSSRLGETLGVMGRGFPYVLGLKRRRAEAH
jgi:uncharacterized protein DUF2652